MTAFPDPILDSKINPKTQPPCPDSQSNKKDVTPVNEFKGLWHSKERANGSSDCINGGFRARSAEDSASVVLVIDNELSNQTVSRNVCMIQIDPLCLVKVLKYLLFRNLRPKVFYVA